VFWAASGGGAAWCFGFSGMLAAQRLSVTLILEPGEKKRGGKWLQLWGGDLQYDLNLSMKTACILVVSRACLLQKETCIIKM
jgi:hypothetical protein